MTERTWPTKITHEEMRERIGIACCALDKIAQWTDEDNDLYGDPCLFARVAIEQVMAPSKIIKAEGNKSCGG